MITPLEIARMGIRYFVHVLGWNQVSRLVDEVKPESEQLHAWQVPPSWDEDRSITIPDNSGKPTK